MWVLDLAEPLVLKPESGEAVHLPYRKVGEALAALAETPGALIQRAQLSASLWPDLPKDSGLCNLRQCLSKIRAVLGDSAIVGDRKRCGLLATFPIQIVHRVGPTQQPTVAASPLSAFSEFAVWLAKDSPRRVLDVLRAAPELGLALERSELEKVVANLNLSNQPEHLKGWVDYWIGFREVFGNLGIARTRLSRAVEHADRTNDDVLLEHASYWLGVVHILQGRVVDAKPVLVRAQHRLAGLRGRGFNRNLVKLEATILLHEGRNAEAYDRLELLSYRNGESEAEFVADEALRGLYLAFSGEYRKAKKLTDSIRHLRSYAHNTTAIGFTSLTNALLEAADNDRSGEPLLEELSEEFAAAGLKYLEIYCRESLAVHLNRSGKIQEGFHALKRAENLRLDAGIGFTRWDQGRIAPMLR